MLSDGVLAGDAAVHCLSSDALPCCWGRDQLTIDAVCPLTVQPGHGHVSWLPESRQTRSCTLQVYMHRKAEQVELKREAFELLGGRLKHEMTVEVFTSFLLRLALLRDTSLDWSHASR